MRFYLHAFCLDESKEQPDHPERWSGPFDWFTVTWDFLRAGTEDSSLEDHQFMRDESGFWYPVVSIELDAGKRLFSVQADVERGRFSDIEIVKAGLSYEMPGTESPRTITTIDERDAFELAKEAEKKWMDERGDE